MKREDDKLVSAVTKALDQQADQIDAATLQSIGDARRNALAQMNETAHSFRSWCWLAGGAIAFACSALIISAILFRPEIPLDFSPQGLELELMASQDDLEFYEELEFYRWLDQMEEAG